ncbi:MAG: hypothetical protein ACYDEP_03645 [Acidimicrobiales bacterium]
MKRPIWFTSGVVVGVGGTIWAERRVRKIVEETTARLSTEHALELARSRIHGARDRVRNAIDAGRDEIDRREEQLRGELGLDDIDDTVAVKKLSSRTQRIAPSTRPSTATRRRKPRISRRLGVEEVTRGDGSHTSALLRSNR